MTNFKKLLAVLLALCAAASLFALDGIVIEVTGKCEIQDGDDWIQLEEGDELGPGDVISTGFKSEVVIALDETTLTVNALTRITLEQLFELNGDKASTMFLDAGSISASVRSEEDKKVAFKVKTPAVTASVRGTDGDVFVNRVEGRSGSWLLTPPEPKLTKDQIAANHKAEQEMVAAVQAAAAGAEAGETETAAEETAETTEAAEETAVAEAPAESAETTEVAESTETTETTTAVAEAPAATEPAAPANIGFGDYFSSLDQVGGVIVHQGEVSTVATSTAGGFALNTPQQTAVAQATSLGSSTTTPSSQEAVAALVPETPAAAAEAAAAGETLKATVGGLKILITWED